MPKVALFLIDVQRDTVSRMPGMKEAVKVAARALKYAREKAMPVFYLVDSHKADDPEVLRVGEHCMEGTEGARVAEGLEPREGDMIITKREQSAFANPALVKKLEELGIEEVWEAGDVCVYPNAKDLLQRGIRVKVFGEALGCPYGQEKLMKELEAFEIPLIRIDELR